MTTRRPDVEVDFDEPWCVIDDRAGHDVVAEHGSDVPAEVRDELAAVLDGLIDIRRRDTDVITAAVLLPEPPIDSVVAYAQCRWYTGGAVGGSVKHVYKAMRADPDHLPHEWRIATGLGTPVTPHTHPVPPVLEWQDVDPVTLPAGKAVRVHDLAATAEPIETVAHIMPSPKHAGGVVLMVSWARLHGMRPFGGPVHADLYDSAAPDSSRGLTLHADAFAESLRVGSTP